MPSVKFHVSRFTFQAQILLDSARPRAQQRKMQPSLCNPVAVALRVPQLKVRGHREQPGRHISSNAGSAFSLSHCIAPQRSEGGRMGEGRGEGRPIRKQD
jgi:hypothetical protein